LLVAQLNNTAHAQHAIEKPLLHLGL
jgi:hypothetical protein